MYMDAIIHTLGLHIYNNMTVTKFITMVCAVTTLYMLPFDN